MGQEEDRRSAYNAWIASGKDASKLSKNDQFHLAQIAQKEMSTRGNKLRTDLYGRHDKHQK